MIALTAEPHTDSHRVKHRELSVFVIASSILPLSIFTEFFLLVRHAKHSGMSAISEKGNLIRFLQPVQCSHLPQLITYRLGDFRAFHEVLYRQEG